MLRSVVIETVCACFAVGIPLDNTFSSGSENNWKCHYSVSFDTCDKTDHALTAWSAWSCQFIATCNAILSCCQYFPL